MSERLYKILGASPSCSDEELRSIYRKLVRTAHPDVCGASKENVQRFLEIQKSYDELVEMRRKQSSKTSGPQRHTRPAPAYAHQPSRAATQAAESDDFVEDMFDTLCKDLGSLASSVKSIFKIR